MIQQRVNGILPCVNGNNIIVNGKTRLDVGMFPNICRYVHTNALPVRTCGACFVSVIFAKMFKWFRLWGCNHCDDFACAIFNYCKLIT